MVEGESGHQRAGLGGGVWLGQAAEEGGGGVRVRGGDTGGRQQGGEPASWQYGSMNTGVTVSKCHPTHLLIVDSTTTAKVSRCPGCQ